MERSVAIVVSVGQEGRSLVLRVMSGVVMVTSVRGVVGGLLISPVPRVPHYH